MASISKETGGRRRIQFVDGNGKRRSVYLGKCSQRFAENVKLHVEALAVAKGGSVAVEPATVKWVREISDELAGKLAKVGLIEPRERAALKAFIDGYIAERADVKPGTRIAYRQTRRCLLEYFGDDRPLHRITQGDADGFRLWLVNHEKLADNTVRRRCGIARQFLRVAVRRRLIDANPFSDMPVSVRRNEKRYYFISLAEAAAVLKACPDAQWRLMFALARFGGLRCPSEHLGLRWGDVDWERGRIRVHSPKTERHPGGESREIPIFPELRPYLEAVWDQAEPGTEWVITRYRDTSLNLRTQLLRIIWRAGLREWPKLWQNLRSTRQTELAETYPLHVVCDWIGNSAAVAAEHYLQTTDEHYRQAVQEAAEKVVHQPVQLTHENPGESWKPKREDPRKPKVFQGLPQCTKVQIGPGGFEPPTKGL